MPRTLLLADDSVVIQKLVGLSFANEKIELITTDNGDDAVARALEAQPDLVLADVVMPGKNGYEVCEAIKQSPETAGTPVLLLTGTFEAFDEKRAREAGADGHITKPFEAQVLVERVNELLEQAAKAKPSAAAAPAEAAPAAAQSYDFFDAEVQNLGGDFSETTETAPPAAREAVQPPAASAFGATSLDDSFSFDDGLALDSEPETAPGGSPDPLAAFGDSGSAASAERGGDRTVAILPDGSIPDAFGAPEPAVATPEPVAATPVEAGPLETAIPKTPPPPPAIPSAPAFSPPAPASASSASGGGTESMWPEELETDDDASFEEAAETVLAPEMLGDDLPALDSASRAHPEDSFSVAAPPTGSDLHFGDEPVAAPSGDATVLADDLFGDDSGSPMVPPTPDPSLSLDFDSEPATPPASSDFGSDYGSDYDVSSSDLGPALGRALPEVDASLEADPFEAMAPPSPEDLEDPLAASASDAARAPLEDPLAMPDFSSESFGPPGADSSDTTEPEVLAFEPAPLRTPVTSAVAGAAVAATTTAAQPIAESTPLQLESDAPVADRGPDISPMMRARVHETLEKVAWEAFSDISDTIVKEVLARVEAIAWEVIPKMAETLIEEEIRRMKDASEE